MPLGYGALLMNLKFKNMKKLALTLLVPLTAFSALAQNKKTVKKTSPTSKTAAVAIKNGLDSASYAFGTSMAANLKNNGLDHLNYDLFVKGLKDAFGDKALLLPKEKSQAAINNLFVEASKKKFAPAIAEGKAFLENNKKVAGIKTTSSGLQYQVLQAGSGAKPLATDTVLVHYKGTLLNGKQFDSSYDRKEPISFPLNRVIPGWTEGVQLMEQGSKYKFFIPYNLAYGERGAGQDIPPYSTLIFEVELLKINGK